MLIKNLEILSQIVEVQYRKESHHGDANRMSRSDPQNQTEIKKCYDSCRGQSSCPVNDTKSNNSAVEPSENVQLVILSSTFDSSLSRIGTEQQMALYFGGNWKQIKMGKWSGDKYVLENQVLYKVLKSRVHGLDLKVICVPKSMKHEVIQCYYDHLTGAHFGTNRISTRTFGANVNGFLGSNIGISEEKQ